MIHKWYHVESALQIRDTLLKYSSLFTLVLCYHKCLIYPKKYQTISQFAARSDPINRYVFILIYITDIRIIFKKYKTWFDILELCVSWLVLLKMDKNKKIQSLLHCFGALILMLHGIKISYTKLYYIWMILLPILLLSWVKKTPLTKQIALLSEVLIFGICILVKN